MSWADEDGVTLIEFLTVMVMMVVLLGATIPMLLAATNQGNTQSNRIGSVDSVRVALDRMTRDLRQACSITPASGSAPAVTETLLVNTTAGYLSTCSDYSPAGALHQIKYDCGQASATAGDFKCVRNDLTAGTNELVIDQITNGNAFTISGASGGHPQVNIALQQLPSGASRAVRLQDSATATLVTLP